MKTVHLLLVATALTSGLPPPARAQQRLPDARPSADEVRAIREMVEKQGREIDEMKESITKLNDVLLRLSSERGGGHTSDVKPLASTHETPTPVAVGPTPTELLAPTPASAPVAPASPPAAEPRVEKAEPAGTQHTVAKGETLTSIAKHYNVSITELHKANKITDDRKLQIGQVLQIPTKTTETPTEKKETP